VRRSLAALPLALALAAPAGAQDAPAALSAAYLCDGGAVLPVAYVNPETGPSLAVIAWAGRLIPLRAGPTGSGVRYVAFDAAEGFVWHTKGDSGTLFRDGGADPAAQETVLQDCRRIDGG
jgi:membrane-bound inhibitor of C-type lysozyme